MDGPMAAQQRKEDIPVQRTFVPDEPQPCIEFDRMAARLDAVYKTEEISKPDYDEAMKKYRDGTQEEGVDYFIGGKEKKQTNSLTPEKHAEFICCFSLAGGRAVKSGYST